MTLHLDELAIRECIAAVLSAKLKTPIDERDVRLDRFDREGDLFAFVEVGPATLEPVPGAT